MRPRVSIDIRGFDAYGPFAMSTVKPCGVCGAHGLSLRYTQLPARLNTAEKQARQIRSGVDVCHTILDRCYPPGKTYGQGAGYIGMTCGCYAKFHRQIAHIVDSMKSRGTLPPDA